MDDKRFLVAPVMVLYLGLLVFVLAEWNRYPRRRS
jgi:hypothetical protein